MEIEVKADGRRARGDESRALVLHEAVNLASVVGLHGLTFGSLALRTGRSKAGIQILFSNKEKLQLETVAFARGMFADAVIRPALSTQRGLPRLKKLFGNWIRYATEPLFEGGCFMVANLAEIDSLRGPLHDALFADHASWISVLAGEIRFAVEAQEILDTDPEVAAFAVDAILCATNTSVRAGDANAIARARRALDIFLVPVGV